MDLNERLTQCRKDKEAIEKQEKEILEKMKDSKFFKVDNINVTLWPTGLCSRKIYCSYPIGISIHGNEAYSAEWKENRNDASCILRKESAQRLVDELQRLINQI